MVVSERANLTQDERILAVKVDEQGHVRLLEAVRSFWATAC